MGRILVAAASVAVIGGDFFLSLFPVPDGPWRYLPYMFVGLLAAGMILSWRLEGRAYDGNPTAAAQEFGMTAASTNDATEPVQATGVPAKENYFKTV
jgi:hypothetical protein